MKKINLKKIKKLENNFLCLECNNSLESGDKYLTGIAKDGKDHYLEFYFCIHSYCSRRGLIANVGEIII